MKREPDKINCLKCKEPIETDQLIVEVKQARAVGLMFTGQWIGATKADFPAGFSHLDCLSSNRIGCL